MNYIGNIGSLRKSVFVKAKAKNGLSLKEKLQKNNKILLETKLQYKNILEGMYAGTAHVEEKKIVSPYDSLIEIRNKYKDEIRQHGEQTRIKEGFVYLVENPAYPNWIKAGMSIDYEQRLSNYNRYDPECKFVIIGVKWVNDRRFIEKILLDRLADVSFGRKGEWFKVDKNIALSIFESK